MPDQIKIHRLATLLMAARTEGCRLPRLDPDLQPRDVEAADAVQDAVADVLGPVGAYKVAQVGDGPGSWGSIFASAIFPSPAEVRTAGNGLKIETEIGFVFGQDLPGRADGRAYDAAAVVRAIEGAFVAFELVDSRLPVEPKPSALSTRADAMGNWGLVHGPVVSDWQPLMDRALQVTTRLDGKTILSQRGGHPSGNPFHPLVWLANALARRGRGLHAGQSVITGAFAPSRPISPGDAATADIEGLGRISFRLTD